jgi:anti-sigma factor RsiW
MTMHCTEILPRLNACLDGELPADQAQVVEDHVKTCQGCRHQFERISQVGGLLDMLDVPPLPQEFAFRVMAEARRKALRLPEKRPLLGVDWLPLRWFTQLTIPMRLAACAMVLLACLLGMFMSRDLSVSSNSRTTVAEAENLDGFEWFSPTPPASLGSAYLTLASTSTEEQGVR